MISEDVLDAIDSSAIIINGKKHTIADFTAIDQESLSDEFAEQASVYAYVGMLVADAEAFLNEVKMEKDIAYANSDADYRDDLNKRGEKYTESVIRSLVILDGEYKQVCTKETEAAKNYKTLRALHEAIRQRGEMLISLGATLRAEADITGMVIKTKESLKKSTTPG